MDANQILTADLDDIIFYDRNKSYGAYYLRRNYSKHLTVAMLITIVALSIVLGIPFIKSMLQKEEPITKKFEDAAIVQPPPPLDRTKPILPPPNLPPPPKTIKFTPPVIKPDPLVTNQDELPPAEELKEAIVAPVTIDSGKANFTAPEELQVVGGEPAKPFITVDQMPEFPGGVEELQKYLAKNIHYPAAARENGIEGKVVLQFVVDENGNISDIETKRDIGGGCADEAIRVVKNMPVWKPGKQNGNAVKVYFTLPVTFKLGTE